MADINGLLILILLLATGVGLGAGYFLQRRLVENKIKQAEEQAKKILEGAEKEAENKKREALLEAKDRLYHDRAQLEEETRARWQELQNLERRLIQREETLDRRTDYLERREREVIAQSKELNNKEKLLVEKEKELAQLIAEERKRLERISGLTVEEAKKFLLENIESEVRHEAALKIKEIEEETREIADKKAKEILSLAIQRCAADHTAETTVSVVTLPSDEMKGRIIGREGRNIRALETATGVDLIIDDTPEAVILSAFDPVRREIARLALEKLIVDGRIHPARIEETVEKIRKEVEDNIREAGEQAIFEAGVQGLHPEEVKLLGRLKYRTSYGQNVLQHSKEVAFLAGMMASELGEDVQLAKRIGLLHDIGKAVDHEVEGSHAQIGADMGRKYNESPRVVHAIAAHHNEEVPRTVEAVLIAAADAISASRPGARRETLETYIKRLEKLEKIADSFPGVEKAYAIQAGREIRIIVKPEEISDGEVVMLARDIAKRIEKELEYPGQIKVNVIRETRAVEYAK